ncbi:unnamed protein product [Adineta steineri]|uniref:Uncharacterized protein n=2 Tax=Adineta steineri TaxID=433720 RepID=A0A815LGL1_9BILA|nr:unnamed protein product [Adineta steineri]
MMVEQWNFSCSFEQHYEACSPNYCTYSYTTHTYDLLGIIIQMISMIGGLTVALRLITPQIVRIILRLISPQVNTKPEVPMKIYDRIKILIRKVAILMYTTLVNLNTFPIRVFGSNTHRAISKKLGKITTRFYIILLIIGLNIFILYNIVNPQTLTKAFMKPSLTTYKSLVIKHGNTLQCPCSSITSVYDAFINIEPIFHPICLSPFASDEWRINVTKDLVPDLSIYTAADYRRFLSSHLQFLTGLCQLSIQSVNNSINQFLSSFFITAQLVPSITFDQIIYSLINQSKMNAPLMFSRFLFLLRTTNHGNAIVSAYETNFKYVAAPWYDSYSDQLAITQAITYDDGCSCALYSNCTTQAGFVQGNSSEIFQITGLKMGCTSSESFLSSTLECFYDLSCINLIQSYTSIFDEHDIANASEPLSITDSRFLMNTTIMDLINDLFVDQWSTTINYSAYFDQCSPTFCSYTYVQQFNSLYTVTVSLGFYGGLSFILKWICPKIIYYLFKLNQFRKKRTNTIQSTNSLEMNTTENVNITIISKDTQVTDVNSKTMITISPPSIFSFSKLLCIIIVGILITIMIVMIIIPFVYLNQHKKNEAIQTILSTTLKNTTINTDVSITTISTSTISTSQLIFETIRINGSQFCYSDSRSSFIAVGDFNSDNCADIVHYTCDRENINVVLNYNDGSFQVSYIFSFDDGNHPYMIIVDDFDGDGRLDFAFTNNGLYKIGILLGDGTGNFGELKTFLNENPGQSFSFISNDFNNDGHVDIVTTYYSDDQIVLLVGVGDGTFFIESSFYNNFCSRPTSFATGDFNNDNQMDLAVTSSANYLCILLNTGNEQFDLSMMVPTETFNFAWSIITADFNNDNHLDISMVNYLDNNIAVMFGNNDGTFGTQMIYKTGILGSSRYLITGDFDNDGQLDLVINNYVGRSINILFGSQNGTFLNQITFTVGGVPLSIAKGDFNNDKKLDLVVTFQRQAFLSILLNTCNFGRREFVMEEKTHLPIE